MKKIILTTAILLISFAIRVAAQPEPKDDNMIRENRERIIERIIEHKHRKIRETLSLDDEQAKRFFEVYRPAEKTLGDLMRERQMAEERLLELTRGEHTDSDVDPTLDRIKEINQKLTEHFERLNNDLKQILNPRQRARLQVFEREFNRRLQDEIQRRRQERGDRPDRPDRPDRRPFDKRPENPEIRPRK